MPESSLADRILSTGFVESDAGERLPVRSSISAEEGHALQLLIRAAGCRTAVEIGLAYGISALFIGAALQNGSDIHHYIIDPKQQEDWSGIGLTNLRRAGLDGPVEFSSDPSYAALPRLLERGVRVDFGFIDGFHVFDYALLDFFYVDLLLNVGGIVAFDDANWKSLRALRRFIERNRSYTLLRAPPQPPLTHRAKTLTKQAVNVVAGSMGQRGQKLIRPVYDEPDQLVAFRKDAEDNRHWTFHRRF